MTSSDIPSVLAQIRTSRIVVSCFVAFCILLVARTGFALSLDELTPPAAGVGVEVELSASGLDPAELYTLTVAGTQATVTLVEADRLRFVVPGGATSGRVELSANSAPNNVFEALFPFTVTRPLDVSFDPTLGTAVTGYGLGSAIADATGSGPIFSIDVPVGQVGLAIGAGSVTQSLLLQVVSDTTVSAELGALSTAKAIVFITPTVLASDPAEAATRLALIESLPETAALAALISNSLANGSDYLDDPAYSSRLLAAIRAFEVAPQPVPLRTISSSLLAEDYVRGKRSYWPDYPRDLAEPQGLALLNRLAVIATEAGTAENGVPNLGMKWDSTETALFSVPVLGQVSMKINPVDWIAGIYELQPGQFPGGIDDVDALVANGTAYDRRSARPLDHLLIASKDPTRFIDIGSTLVSKLAESFKPPAPDLRVRSDRSGVYMVRAYSGAHYPSQDALIAALPDGQIQSSRALALNLFIAGLDTMGLIASELGGTNRKELVRIGFDVYLTMERVIEEKSRGGAISADDMLAIQHEGLSLLLRKVAGNIVFFEGRSTFGKLIKKAAKFLSPIAKVATVGKLASRTLALWNFPMFPNVNLVQGVESTVVVVGNPWRPEITGFTPRKGHLGTVVTLHGQNFSNTPTDNLVEFNAPLSTDPTLLPTAPAEVIESPAVELRAAVPPDAARGLGPISIQRNGKGKFWTSENAPPFDLFEVLPAPIVTAIEPAQYIPGHLVKIIGSNFSQDMTRNIIVLTDTSLGDVYRSEAWSGSSTELLFRDPNIQGEFTLRVQVADVANPSGVVDASNAIPYVRQPVPSGSTGLIRVTSYLDNLTPDDQITLREAIAIAAGTLGRPLTTCDVDPSCERENVVENTPGFYGAGVREVIERHPFLGEGGTINIDPGLGALPAIEGGDSIGLLAFVDGGGGNFSGLTINGQTGVSVSWLRFRNFGQHGLHLIDAVDTRLAAVQVLDCGGTGILLEGSTTDTEILSSLVSGCTGHGLHLSGAGVRRNGCSGGSAFGMQNNGGDGILLDGGTSANGIDCGAISGNLGAGIRVIGSPLNAIGDSGRSAILSNKPVEGNTGGGVVVDNSSGLRIFRLDIRGNGSHGIDIGGSGSRDIEVQAVQVGPARDLAGSVIPNLGHGIYIHGGASAITVGTRAVGGINEPPGSMIAGNTGFGILISGPDTTDVVVNHTVVGGSQPNDAPPPPIIPYGNDLGGIALQDGTHDNRLGDSYQYATLDVIGHSSSAGVLIEGGAHHNWIYGANFGSIESDFFQFQSTADMGNFYGIHIRGGAYGNLIGARGSRLDAGYGQIYRWGNSFRWSLGAGMLIESGGFVSGSQVPGVTPTPTGANVVINNVFGDAGFTAEDRGANDVGLILRAGAVANRIGGVDSGERNNFARNTMASLWIDGYAISEPYLTNRIIGNDFRSATGPNLPADPLVAIPDGVGVLLTNASGHVIGGANLGEGNRFFLNYIGLYDQGGSGNHFVGNDIGLPPNTANRTAGIVLSGTTGCVVGPNNQILSNGKVAPGPALGGVAIHGGSENQVWGNAIGTDRAWTGDAGNSPWGILLDETVGNVVGGSVIRDWSVIGNNLGPGVLLQGLATTDNRLIGNWIGVSPNGNSLGNTGSGVELASGAHGNAIGDGLRRAPGGAGAFTLTNNIIYGNGAHGIHVHDGGTAYNTILDNIISNNAGAGIRLETGGNGMLPAPTITAFSGQRAFGDVDPSVPDGSIVQIFSDPDGEGLVPVGEGPVAAGRFAIETGFVSDDITATVTIPHPQFLFRDADTSEFSTFFPASIALSVTLSGETKIVAAAAPGETDVAVLPLKVRAINGPVQVLSLTLDALGSLVDNIDVVQVLVYRDVDGDGLVGDDDQLISDPGTFDADDGSVILTFGDVSVATLAPQTWLVALDLSPAAAFGAGLELSLSASTAVSAASMLSASIPVPAIGVFPIVSDPFTLVVASLDSDADGVPDIDDVCPTTPGAQVVDDLGCSCDELAAAGRLPTGDPFLCPEPSVALLQGTALLILIGLGMRRRTS